MFFYDIAFAHTNMVLLTEGEDTIDANAINMARLRRACAAGYTKTTSLLHDSGKMSRRAIPNEKTSQPRHRDSFFGELA